MNHTIRPLGWERFPSLIAIPTAGDGSCALHAIVQAFHTPYQMGKYPDGNTVNRYEFVRSFRNELADLLNQSVNGNEKTTWYDTLSRGEMEEYAKSTKNLGNFPDLSREGFEKHLRSSAWLGQEIIEYVSVCLGIGIIVLFTDGRGRYELNVIGRDADLVLENKKKVVIILNMNNTHFMTVGRREMDGSLRVFFDSSDTMIKEMSSEFVQSYE